MEKEIKKRGLKKGTIPTWKVGRKPTGRVRNMSITFKVSSEEKEYIEKLLKSENKSKVETLLEKLKKLEKIENLF